MTCAVDGRGASAALAGTRVFLAEDDPTLLFVLEAVVADLGCRVVGTAARVRDALAFLDANRFDVAVVDLALADGNADALLAALVARGTPFVVTSGTAPPADRRNGGIHLRKPYTDRDLHAALLDTVGRASGTPI